MRTLNTMFIEKSNTTFNNILFSCGKIQDMGIHATTQRLYEAAEKLKQIKFEGRQTAVAKLLGESPQTVKNWESRGVSQRGAIAAQKIIGCSATWIKDGAGEMRASASVPPPAPAVSALAPRPLALRYKALEAALKDLLLDDDSIKRHIASIKELADPINAGVQAAIDAMNAKQREKK